MVACTLSGGGLSQCALPLLTALLLLFAEGTVDWATAEAIAFGSLVKSGAHVRLVGQDSQRGTFSQRHAVLTCQVRALLSLLTLRMVCSWCHALPRSCVSQDSAERYTPLNALSPSASAKLEVVSCNLSEFAVMGFEYGFSLESPRNLCLWEAQFGDFANCAQVIIDNFIAGSETKWMRPSALTLLLPHGELCGGGGGTPRPCT